VMNSRRFTRSPCRRGRARSPALHAHSSDNLGRALHGAGKFEQAIAAFKKAIDIYKSYVMSREELDATAPRLGSSGKGNSGRRSGPDGRIVGLFNSGIERYLKLTSEFTLVLRDHFFRVVVVAAKRQVSAERGSLSWQASCNAMRRRARSCSLIMTSPPRLCRVCALPVRAHDCDVSPAAGLCFRKPSLIACLIPSSIKVLATSGTLVP
jgi:hypothetical protein